MRICLWALGLCLLMAPLAEAGRYSQFTNRAAQGPKMELVSATYFGSESIEQFVGAGSLADGTIVAFGNAWGPQFPDQPQAMVLGRGEHRGLDVRDGRGNLRPQNPDIAGMMVFYSDDLQEIRRVVRFDWGVATIERGIVALDGSAIFIAGRYTEAFAQLAGAAAVSNTAPAPAAARDRGPYDYEGVRVSGDVYLARLSPDGQRIEWVWVFPGLRNPAQEIWVTRDGALFADLNGLRRISPDGREHRMVNQRWDGQERMLVTGGPRQYLAVNPDDESFYFGGDRNTHTGRQPWRQPFMYGFDAAGNRTLRYWEWPPRDHACGGGGSGMCSDSSPRTLDFGRDGTLVVSGWSDGGNTVFNRQPTEIGRATPSSTFGMSAWGMRNANSLAHIMRINPETNQVVADNLWVSYIPMTFESERHRGAPNFTSIHQLRVLENGAVAFVGSAATGLIQTPGAFYRYPGDGRRFGGSFAAVFSEDFRHLLFSSYLPGCQEPRLAPVKGGMVVLSRSTGSDGHVEEPTPTPTHRAHQPEKRGAVDAHIILLRNPPEEDQ